MKDSTDVRQQWLDEQKWDRRFRHLRFCAMVYLAAMLPLAVLMVAMQ